MKVGDMTSMLLYHKSDEVLCQYLDMLYEGTSQALRNERPSEDDDDACLRIIACGYGRFASCWARLRAVGETSILRVEEFLSALNDPDCVPVLGLWDEITYGEDFMILLEAYAALFDLAVVLDSSEAGSPRLARSKDYQDSFYLRRAIRCAQRTLNGERRGD